MNLIVTHNRRNDTLEAFSFSSDSNCSCNGCGCSGVPMADTQIALSVKLEFDPNSANKLDSSYYTLRLY